eukprot:scaffold133731_cov39-Tisochrysis_lutea.AAC.2
MPQPQGGVCARLCFMHATHALLDCAWALCRGAMPAGTHPCRMVLETGGVAEPAGIFNSKKKKACAHLRRMTPNPCRIVLENSGVAEPAGIRDRFNEAEAEGHPLLERLYLDTMVTLVDCQQSLGLRAPIAGALVPNHTIPQQSLGRRAPTAGALVPSYTIPQQSLGRSAPTAGALVPSRFNNTVPQQSILQWAPTAGALVPEYRGHAVVSGKAASMRLGV